MTDLVFLTVSEIAHLIRERKVSVSEVVETYLQHIAQHNPKLNVIVTSNEDAARQRAKEADAALARGEVWGPLHGVPVTIKDVYETAGLRTTSSFEPLAEYIPHQDATGVARLREAGAIILGKTNMPMMALDAQSDSPIFGRANNPWDVNRTPGGSDVGGSLRLPAHYCGIYCFKPTEQRVSNAGHIPPVPGAPHSIRHMASYGPMARSVEDLRLAFMQIAGPDDRDWGVPPVPMAEVSRRPLNEYRIAWTKGGFAGMAVSQEVQNALERVAQTLSDAGCTVKEIEPPGFDFEQVFHAWGIVLGSEMGAGMSAFMRFMMAMQFRLMPDRSTVKRSLVKGLSVNMSRYAQALTQRDALITTFEKFLANWDVWLCPVASGAAFTHRKMGAPIEVDGIQEHYHNATIGHTCIFNLVGSPVVVLPIGHTKDGLPIGMQAVGRRWDDMALLSTAEALAEVVGTFQKPPGY